MKKFLCTFALFAIIQLLNLLVNATSANAATYYVSKNGNNSGGTSWANAWNELSNINWGAVNAGDTILIDGGGTPCPSTGLSNNNCGMVYNSTLSIGKSGTASQLITIRLAPDAGKNGAVVIDGGINPNAPGIRCSGYVDIPSGTKPSSPGGAGIRTIGVNFNSSNYVVLDGTKWGGIEIRNHTRAGLDFGSGDNSTARYIKIYNNTDPNDVENGSHGVNAGPGALNATLSRLEVFQNGQDAVRGGGDGMTLEESYLHDTYCNHPDGVQIFGSQGSLVVNNVVIRRNVFDKIGLQSIFMGENANGYSTYVDGAEIYDNLLLNNYFGIKSKHGSTTNWNIYNNTIYKTQEYGLEWCCASPGARAPMTVRNNIFYQIKQPGGTGFWMPTGNGTTTFQNNCVFDSGSVGGNVTNTGTITSNPQFINASAGNFALSPTSPCAGKGASITSLTALLGSSTPVPTTVPPTITPLTTPTPPPPVANFFLEAEAGVLSGLFSVTPGSPAFISQNSQTTDPTQGGRAEYVFNLANSGTYEVKMRVNAGSAGSNSVFFNIDAEPDTSMVWDMPLTNGFEMRTGAWQGTNPVPTPPQYSPKTFNLTAGTHRLIIRGREANTQIDQVFVDRVVSGSPTPNPLPGDINGDRTVNILDYTLLSNAFGTNNTAADLNSDLTVNILDYIILSNNFGRTSILTPTPTIPVSSTPTPSSISNCGITNFAWTKVNQLARGAQPTTSQIACLGQNGFTTIIRQNQATETATSESAEQTAAQNAGMTYIGAYKLTDDTAYSPQTLQTMITDIVNRLNSGERILVHDTAGRGRMGFWDATFLMWDSMTAQQAIENRYLAKALPFDGAKIDCANGGNGQVQALADISQFLKGTRYLPQVDEYGTAWANCPKPSYMSAWDYSSIVWPSP